MINTEEGLKHLNELKNSTEAHIESAIAKIDGLNKLGLSSREISLTKTKLEEAQMWFEKELKKSE